MNTSTFLHKTKTYLKKPWVIAVLVIVVIIIFFSVRSGSTTAKEEIVAVKSATVSEEVSVTGKVKAAQAVNLAFEKSGKVAKVGKEVGETVAAGDIIVQLDNADLAAQLAQAQASLRFQQSKLDELEAGTRSEQLDITKTKVLNAQADLDNARIALISALQNAYTSADDAIRNKVDELFENPRSSYPNLKFVSTVTPSSSLESGRVEVESRLDRMRKAMATLNPTSTDIKTITDEVKKDLGEIKLFMDNLSLTVNALQSATYLSQTTLATWKADVSLARTSVNTAITTVLTGEDKYRAAQAAYDLANRQLTLDTSGAVVQEREAQRAQVAQAQASVSAVYAQLAKTYIKSPIDGIVTKQEAKVGETIMPNTTIASVISDAQFEIEANIPEADIAKIKLGQKSSVTLDAYGSDVSFMALIVAIDPAETIVDGVPTYKTTFQFEGSDARIKSGMTANIDVRGETKENVLAIPQRAISSRSGSKYVIVKQADGTTQEIKIKTGLRGSDGLVEIMEGLNEGDQVVISQK